MSTGLVNVFTVAIFTHVIHVFRNAKFFECVKTGHIHAFCKTAIHFAASDA